MSPAAIDWRLRFLDADCGYVTPCRVWTGSTSGAGYGSTRVGGRRVYVHRLVWTLAHGDPGALFVLHHCDNPPCARLDHLFLGTARANTQDMIAKGRRYTHRMPGESHPNARLTGADVLAIRASDIPAYTLAEDYGVANSVIYNIRNHKTWRHLP